MCSEEEEELVLQVSHRAVNDVPGVRLRVEALLVDVLRDAARRGNRARCARLQQETVANSAPVRVQDRMRQYQYIACRSAYQSRYRFNLSPHMVTVKC